MKKSKYHAETAEQFKIMAWIKSSFHDEGLTEIHLIDRNHVRIHDRDGGMAILTYAEGQVSLREIYQAC